MKKRKQNLKHYHGFLGYEAMYDSETGYYIDVCGNEGHDDFFKGL